MFLPLGIMLLLHTHLYGAAPGLSDADKATAKKIAAPNSLVTLTQVWCSMVAPGYFVDTADFPVRSHSSQIREIIREGAAPPIYI